MCAASTRGQTGFMRTLTEALWQASSRADDPRPLSAVGEVPGMSESLCLEELRANTDSERWRRAGEIVTSGRVTSISAGDGGLTGTVKGSSSYAVTLTGKDGRLSGACSCPCAETDSPRKVYRFCKHTAALGLAALGWASAAATAHVDYSLDDLDEAALRRVMEQTLAEGGSGPKARRAVRAAKVRAGTMSASEAIEGEQDDFGIGVPNGAKIWVDVSDITLALAESSRTAYEKAAETLDVLVGIGRLIEQGGRDDGSDTRECLRLLGEYLPKLESDERGRVGAHAAQRLLFWDDSWGELFGELTDETQELLGMLGEDGRRGLTEALGDVIVESAPTRPRALGAEGTWRAAVAALEDRKENAKVILAAAWATA